ncbi:MAG: hypothetical protein S4CHLAM27_05930 [Chlamydiia bacterium]|nr:hypothetical protein [Chlamydiia bacterium]
MIYVFLWVLCILGAWSVIPYLLHLKVIPESISLSTIFTLVTVQSGIMSGVACILSYFILPKVDLFPFSTQSPLKRIVYPGLIFGLFLGLILFFLNTTVFAGSILSSVHPPAWTGLLASFYGGINEEVLLRLFFFSLVYFLMRKWIKSSSRLTSLWITNIIVAIIFGLGHLPTALKLVEPSSFEYFRILLLNGIPSLVFGYLYWSRGLWTVMLAHFVTDLVVHVFVV